MGGVGMIELTEDERAVLHAGVCPRHRDTAPGVYVCQPCEAAGDAAVERILAARTREAVEAALTEFVQWIAVERAYNGSDYLGQSLYNEGINGVLPEWAREFAAALATAKEEGR